MTLNKIDYEATKNIPVPLGVEQTWQNMTGSRAQNTTYTNTTGRPIMVSISTGTASTSSLLVDGLVASSVFVTGASGGNLSVGAVIVPNGSTYRFNSPNAAGAWLELR